MVVAAMAAAAAAKFSRQLLARSTVTTGTCARLHVGATYASASKDGKDDKDLTVHGQETLPSAPGDGKLTPEGEKKQKLVRKLFEKPFESTYVANRPIEDPIERTLDNLKPKWKRKTKFLKEGCDAYYDVCIIGGGVMGCAVAYFLASRIYDGMKIAVIEKDPTYRKCATTLSVGGIRQQFSMSENVEMSLFGADFLRNAQRMLYVDGVDMPDIHFQPHGYLFLASDKGAETMQRNHEIQTQCGARVELMSPEKLKRRFPWINTEGVALASYGYENEGWFDPYALMACMRIKASQLGVHFIHGEVYNMAHKVNEDKHYKDTPEDEAEDELKRRQNRLIEAHIQLADGDVWPLNSGAFVIAAGPESGHIAYLAGIGSGEGLLRVPLPVEPRKRYVYCVHAPDGPGLNCPLVIDPSGTYFRREGYGGHYLCGRSPLTREMEPAIDNLDVDHDFFEEHVWPVIAKRVDGFNNIKLHSAWAGYYDYNFWDQNAIVGQHPFHDNVFFATGFSGHGIQQAPAVGRAIMELIYDHSYQSIDLTKLGFTRILEDVKEYERNVV